MQFTYRLYLFVEHYDLFIIILPFSKYIKVSCLTPGMEMIVVQAMVGYFSADLSKSFTQLFEVYRCGASIFGQFVGN